MKKQCQISRRIRKQGNVSSAITCMVTLYGMIYALFVTSIVDESIRNEKKQTKQEGLQ